MSGAPDTTSAITDDAGKLIPAWGPGEKPVGNSSDFVSDLKGRSDKVSGALAGEYGKYTQATSVLDQMEQGRIERDRTRMEQSFDMESAAANDPALNHPWNADKERSDRIKGPLENFGSVATIFALAASAFTRTPMNSALTAAGAAMTAMHQNDEEGYKSAYEAWKANSDLAIKRFNIERNLYEDANKLVTTDIGLWRQKRAAIAAQFDDQKRLIMLDNGMDAEVLKADEAWTKAGEQAIDYQKKFEDIELTRNISQQKMKQWSAEHPMPDVSGLPPQEQAKAKAQYALDQYKAKNEFMLEAKHQVAQAGSTARGGLNPNQQQYELIRREFEGDPDAEEKIADKYAAFIRNQKVTGGAGGGVKPGTPSDDNQKMDADIKKEHPDWSSSQVIEERNKRIKASKESTRPSAQAENAKTLADHKADIAAEHPDWSKSKVDDEANRRIAQSKQVISGNRADDLRGQIGRIDRANEMIDRVETLMKTYKMITGLGGQVSRKGEVIGNVLGGSNSTAYNEFKSDIDILKDWWERLENNALTQGRPLSAAEKRVGGIIPGLSMGDTVQHTSDQLLRIKRIFGEMRTENEKRLKGDNDTTPPAATKPSWRTLAIPESP